MKSINKNILKNFTILIVEDDLSVKNSIKLFLEAKSANIVEANNGIEALEKLKEYSIDFIISDIEMPELNGIDFIKRVRENRSNIPIVIISSYDEKEYLLKAIKLNLVDYIIKPITIGKLEKFLEEILKRLPNKNETKYYFKEVDGEYNIVTKEITFKDSVVQKLTKKESMLLDLLIDNKNSQLHRNIIEDKVFEGFMSESALRTLLYRVRKLIGKNSLESLPASSSYRIHFEEKLT